MPRWRPPFITALAAEDRCHLNGLAMADGDAEIRDRPGRDRHAAGLAAEQGRRSGCLIDVASGQTVARGFAMPHSPRVHGGRVWMLHSGAGQLVLVDPDERQGGDGDRTARLHARPGPVRPLRVRRPVEDPRDRRRSAACRSPSGGRS